MQLRSNQKADFLHLVIDQELIALINDTLNPGDWQRIYSGYMSFSTVSLIHAVGTSTYNYIPGPNKLFYQSGQFKLTY